MELKKIAKTIIGVIATSVFPMAEAALLSVDWKMAGDGLLTRDTATGIEWLDVNQTYNKTKNDVSSLTGTGGFAEGFRLATREDFFGLYSGAGLSTSYSEASPNATNVNYIQSARNLQNLIGYSEILNLTVSSHIMAGFLADDGGSPLYSAFGFVGVYDYFSEEKADFYRADSYWVNSPAASYIGLYLVRDVPTAVSVPEPSSLALLGAGALGFGFMRMRRKPAKLHSTFPIRLGVA